MKKKFLAIAILSVLGATCGAMAACDEVKDPGKVSHGNEINLVTTLWESLDADEVTYTVSTSNGSLKVEYEKTGAEWQFIKHNVMAFDNIGDMKTLVIKGEYTASTNNPELTVKFEGSEGLDGGTGTSKEVKIYMDDATKTYEWDLSKLDLTKATRLLMSFDGANGTGTGTATFSKLYLTSTPINKANNVEVEVLTNEITATNKKVDAGWYTIDRGVYTATKSGNDYNVAYNKASEWSMMYAQVKGAELANMKSLKLTVKGTVNEKLMVKPFNKNALEKTVTFTGEDQVIQVDLTKTLDAPVDFTQIQQVLLCVNPGTTNTQGSFVIKNVEFSAEVYTEPAPEVPKEPVNTITAANRKITEWYTNTNDNAFTITKANGAVTVKKVKGVNFVPVVAKVTGAAIKNATSLKIVVNGEIKSFLIETPGDVLFAKKEIKESASTVVSGDNVFELPLKDISAKADDTVYEIKLFFNYEDAHKDEINKSYTIKSAEFIGGATVIKAAEQRLNKAGWYDNSANGDVYSFAEETAGTKVTKLKNEQWLSACLDVTGAELKNMEKFNLVINGDIKQFKVQCDALFAAVEVPRDQAAVNGDNSFSIPLKDISANANDKVYTIMLLFNWDAYSEGINYTIKEANFVRKAVTVASNGNNLTGWYDGSYNSDIYNLEKVDGGLKVTKVNTDMWSPVSLKVTGAELKNMASLKVVVSGDIKQFKVETPDEELFQNKEIAAPTAVNGDNIFELPLKDISANADDKVYTIKLLFNWDNYAQGINYTVKEARFIRKATTATVGTSLTGWYDGDGGKYTLTAGTDGAINVAKVANGSWSALKLDVTGAALATATKLKVTVSGVNGKNIIAKIYEKEAKQEPAAQDNLVLEVDISAVANRDAASVQTIFIFFQWQNDAPASEFTIVSAVFE